MSKIYLSGGIQKFLLGGDLSKATNWREQVEEHYRDDDTMEIVNPIRRFGFDDSASSGMDRMIMEEELKSVHTSDLVVVYFNDPKSLGTMAEITVAHIDKIPVIGVVDNIFSLAELHSWQKFFCDYIVYPDELFRVIDLVLSGGRY